MNKTIPHATWYVLKGVFLVSCAHGKSVRDIKLGDVSQPDKIHVLNHTACPNSTGIGLVLKSCHNKKTMSKLNNFL